jgi:endonuclease/exonuclease/phosphatase family metal-dependent hydrolase
MRLTTFNIRYDRGQDGWFDTEHPRRDRVLAVLRDADADLIGLQEVLAPQLEDLKAGLAGYTCLGVGRNDGARSGEFAPLFVRDQRFTVQTHGTFWLSASPDTPGTTWPPARIPRIATWARLVDRTCDRPLLAINTHFDHEAKPARRASARQLARFVGESDAVLLGDLNALPASLPLRMLRAAGLEDAYQRLYPLRAPFAATWHDWHGRAMGPRIDYILHSRVLSPVTAEIDVRRFDGGTQPWASDHHPVHARLRWRD